MASAQVVNNKLSHYLYPEFSKAKVKMINGKINEASMNYNTLTEEMVFDQNGVMLAMDQLQYVDTIYLKGTKFIVVGKKFYELVVKAPVSLFIQHKRNISSAGSPVGYGGTSQTASVTSLSSLQNSGGVYKLSLPDAYNITEASVNWIRTKDNWYNFMNERQLLKIFPDKSADIKTFLKNNHIDIKEGQDLVKLVMYINEII